jgi:Zn-dependent protease
MSSANSALHSRCQTCVQQLPPGALVCARCDTLVHADELDRIAGSAKELEAKRQWRAAREQWLKALPLLPPEAEQGRWIRARVQALLNAALDEELGPAESSPAASHTWAKKLGPLGPVVVLLAKGKTLLLTIFKLKFLLTFFSFVAVYWALWGWKFGLGIALLVLVHEMGHFIDIKMRGLPAEMPVFLPLLGAYVSWDARRVSLQTRAAVSLAGPLAGWLASVACVMIWMRTHDPFWAELARFGAFMNVLNLIPIWILDGGQAIAALGRADRIWLLTAALALWLSLGEGVFFLVGVGVAWRIFTKDMPAQSSKSSLAYYGAVLLFLGLVLRLIPGQGFQAR